MKVTLIDYTGKGMGERYAAELLVFTKNTRLKMSADAFENVQRCSDDELVKELEYMSNTIPSSWEFVDYTFMIEGCDRGFTHQLVRTRTGSYAQQTMRILDVSGFDYTTGPTIANDPALGAVYECAMEDINSAYEQLVANGAAIEDARGVLPTNIKTNIVAKFSMRTCAELIAKRSSPRTQGMYRDFIEQMREQILEVHPWANLFLRNRKIQAAQKLDEFIQGTYDRMDGVPTSQEEVNQLIKLVDILRS